ncbi:hypothetical protein O4H49_13030 [Kiloniella laminariae]|uniref:Uncharacterized protein n=1 Tax=Kiloniella laminariae TaxID=454162 RepID=A0ABT4LKR8_9PROT|nr:hypothetical protein [Kiloniella laminariae]MCZ4281707.1 hypothetical protein [Kiloniella laminariae]
MSLEQKLSLLANRIGQEFTSLRNAFESKTVVDTGTKSGAVVIDYRAGGLYQEGQIQKITVGGNITNLTVMNWPDSGKAGKLTLYLNLSSANTVDFTFVSGWALGSAPTLAVGLNELVFTTIDGGAVVIGHAVALGIAT